MTKPNLDEKPREFWITRDLITKGNKVVDSYDVHLDDKQPSIDEYNHGVEVIHVIERSAYDRLHQQLIEEREHGAKVWEANKEKARRIRELEDALYEILSNVTMPEKYRLCGNRALKRDGEE